MKVQSTSTINPNIIRSNPTILDEAFSFASATEARFTYLQLWEMLRSNPTTLREAFFLTRITEAHFEDQWSSFFSNKTSSNNSGLQNQNLTTSRFTMRHKEPIDKDVFVKQAIDVESTSDNDARDQASEVETKVLVDGEQDYVKGVKVVGVADEQNSEEPHVLEGNVVIGVRVNENSKEIDKEVQYSIYTLHVFIQLLKRLNDKHIKKKKMEAAIQRRL
ncbi:hypothetical protein Tco_1381233 [Tanacetum coccineum]